MSMDKQDIENKKELCCVEELGSDIFASISISIDSYILKFSSEFIIVVWQLGFTLKAQLRGLFSRNFTILYAAVRVFAIG